VAKTSSVPGKTRSLNFYLISNSFYFVDLPGFGYAKVSKSERDYWSKMIEQYFTSRNNVCLAVHLVDSRHQPTDLDILLNEYLKMSSLPYIVLLNKSDKLNQSEMAASRRKAIEMLPDLEWGKNLLFYSSVKKTGVKEIREKLSELLKK
ncbi:MAG: ribosome biogenesis GTP-binding protein YihA/YsxC, partial [Syntrophothermus sp.]